MSDTRSDVRDVERAPCVTEQRGRMRVMRGRWACERLDTLVFIDSFVFEVATCVGMACVNMVYRVGLQLLTLQWFVGVQLCKVRKEGV